MYIYIYYVYNIIYIVYIYIYILCLIFPDNYIQCYIESFNIKHYMYWLVFWNMNFMTFHSVGNVIIPTDELIFFRGPDILIKTCSCNYHYLFIGDSELGLWVPILQRAWINKKVTSVRCHHQANLLRLVDHWNLSRMTGFVYRHAYWLPLI